MKDPDLARVFENAFPSTTDTTIKFHTDGKSIKFMDIGSSFGSGGKWEGPQSFVITGDINAEWLRDSANQLSPYHTLAKADPAIHTLLLGAINTQAEYIIESPYCNAFQPPPITNLPPSANKQQDTVHPMYEPTFVFECKYELDSLAHFLALTNDFYESTGSTEFLHSRWITALETLLDVLKQQAKPTFDPKTGKFERNKYTFQRKTDLGTETLNLKGIGNPLNSGTNLIRSAFRPSDDATVFGFFIPANAQIAAELMRTGAILEKSGQSDLSRSVLDWGKLIFDAVWKHGVVKHPKFGDVFAYEVDGYGSHIFMDDANYPSLLALPVMGFLERSNPVYQNTRRMVLSSDYNPYYIVGSEFRGIGGNVPYRSPPSGPDPTRHTCS